MAGKINLEELLKGETDYLEAAAKIKKMVEEGKIEPVKRSKTNGKRPPLYNRYRILEDKPDVSRIRDEILLSFPAGFKAGFYIDHPAQYEKDKTIIEAIIQAVDKGISDEEISLNERSFDLFADEKLLQSSGMRVLNNLGKTITDLHCVETVEPAAFYAGSTQPGQTVLFCENLDSYRSLQSLLERKERVLGVHIDSIVYGAGHRIERSISDLESGVQSFLLQPENTLLYWGDLDYEGLRIFQSLELRLKPHKLQMFLPAYQAMLEKGRNLDRLPKCRKDQKAASLEILTKQMPGVLACQAAEILEDGYYLPQEILTRADLAHKSHDKD